MNIQSENQFLHNSNSVNAGQSNAEKGAFLQTPRGNETLMLSASPPPRSIPWHWLRILPIRVGCVHFFMLSTLMQNADSFLTKLEY